jgi:hypothetical protein
MASFITVHPVADDSERTINVDSIEEFFDFYEGTEFKGCRICTKSGCLHVAEVAMKVLHLIKNSQSEGN